ncbi:hypothetical protein KM043_013236 [Ampulex compressa]|nr:hypothetical protein KM043_013236 [Ampulex compressa]
MPFVMRKVEPRHLCRGHVPPGPSAQGWPVGAELDAVANGALTTSLKQLASLLAAAEDIFADLTAELTAVADRSGHLRLRLDKVEERLSTVDPKKVPVRKYLEFVLGGEPCWCSALVSKEGLPCSQKSGDWKSKENEQETRENHATPWHFSSFFHGETVCPSKTGQIPFYGFHRQTAEASSYEPNPRDRSNSLTNS